MLITKFLPILTGTIGRPLSAFDLTPYFKTNYSPLTFSAALEDGSSVPSNIQCSSDGIIS